MALPKGEADRFKGANATMTRAKMTDKWHKGRKEREKAKAASQALVPAAPEAASQALVPVALEAPASAEVPTQNTAAEQNLDLEAPDIVSRSTTPWVRPYVPTERGKQDCINHFSDKNTGRVSWIARYSLVEHTSSQLPEGMNKDRAQLTRTKIERIKQTQHACFQYVLGWIWDKAVLTDSTTERPSWVAQALLPCENCTAACPEFAKLQNIVVAYRNQPAKNINAGKSPLRAAAKKKMQEANAPSALRKAVPAAPAAPASAAVPRQNTAKPKIRIVRHPMKRPSPEDATELPASKKARPAIPSPPQDHPKPCFLCGATHIKLTGCPFLPGADCIDQSRTKRILEIILKIACSFGRKGPPKSTFAHSVMLTSADVRMELQIDQDGNCLFAAMSAARKVNLIPISNQTDGFFQNLINCKKLSQYGVTARRETLAWMQEQVKIKAT